MRYFIIILALLGGCTNTTGFLKPAPLNLKTKLDYGPPEMRKGYNDGCETAMNATGTSVYNTSYTQRFSAEFEDNKLYMQTWKEAFSYCYMWMSVWRSEGKTF